MGFRFERPSKRVAWGTAALGVLAVVSVMGALTVPAMSVELDVRTARLSFSSPGDLRLTAQVPLAFLAVLEPLEWGVLPASETSVRTSLVDRVVSLETTQDGAAGIYLQGISLSGDTAHVEIERAAENVYRLFIDGVSEEVRLSLQGRLACSISDEPCEYAKASTARLRPRKGRLALEFQLVGPLTLATRIPATDIDFSRVEGASPGAAGEPRRISAIESGHVYFESLGREPVGLRAFQQLTLRESVGLIRSLDVDSEAIVVNFVGEVSSLRTGVGRAERELLPTWLEWLRTRSTLAFVWGTALALLTLAQAAKRLWS